MALRGVRHQVGRRPRAGEQGAGGVSIEIVRSALRQRNGLDIAIVQVLLCGHGPHLSKRGIADEVDLLYRRIYSGKNDTRFKDTATTTAVGEVYAALL